jgi:pyruvate ferredoxin oxidoreductase delta subunit
MVEGKIVFDLDYCKGCGICTEECPSDAIEMVREA